MWVYILLINLYVHYILAYTICGAVKRIIWGAGIAKIPAKIYILPDF